MYQWDFRLVWSYREELLSGLWVTLELNIIVLFIGTLAGILIGLLSRTGTPLIRWPIKAYIDLFRTLPVLVLLVWFYFCVPILAGGIRISELPSAVIVLSLNLSAFMAEIVRAGINAVPRRYIEDGISSGLSHFQISTRITLPIAARIMLAPAVGQYINTIKLSVLASVIAVPELLHRTTDTISQVYRPLEFYTALAVLFLAILLPCTILAHRVETMVASRYGGLKP